MKFEQSKVFKKFSSSPSYRRQVVRELEESGTIKPLTKKDFGELVYGKKFRW